MSDSDPVQVLSSKATNITQVTDILYLCDYSSITESNLKKNEITFIINCTSDHEHVTFPSLAHIQYLRVPVWDMPTEELGKYLHPTCDKIRQVKESGGRVLVHCVKGVSRSVAICLAYLVKYEQQSLRKAFCMVKSKRAAISPNPGFWRQLITFEKELMGSATVRMLVYPMGAKPDVYRDELKSSAEKSSNIL